ncbi:MAG: hypothetical protein JSW39_21150 [Desulfobacterales bacterium]|nr:MAG: hypothetical protein JSW39_21150 [Desulfobacterales bacterium]
MQKDAHYYAVLAFARLSGFKKEAAHTVAYASQFVDDAKINHIVAQGKRSDLENTMIVGDETHFLNMATCHNYFRSRTFNYSAMMNNTCAFHFVPGCVGNNVSRKFRCKEKSEVIKSIMTDALKDQEQNTLEKFGMALHAYADTFSHQGFSGIPSKVNDIYKPRMHAPILSCRRLYDNQIRIFVRSQLRKFELSITNYGHGQAFACPDMAHVVWSYSYDDTENFTALDRNDFRELKTTKEISNPERFKKAFEHIQVYLEKYLEMHADGKDEEMANEDENTKSAKIRSLLRLLVENTICAKFKESKWKNTIIDLGLFAERDRKQFVEYDKHKWLRDAFSDYDEDRFNHRSVVGVKLDDNNFLNSNWYKFYNAVSWYKSKYYKYCQENSFELPNDYL